MTRSRLIEKLATANPHLHKYALEQTIDVIVGEIAEALARGDRVELRDFGALTVRYRRAR